jgi:hypothetical protein
MAPPGTGALPSGAGARGTGPAPVTQPTQTKPALTASTASERARIGLPPVRARVAPALVTPLLAGRDGGTLLRACNSMAIGDAVNMEEQVPTAMPISEAMAKSVSESPPNTASAPYGRSRRSPRPDDVSAPE